jgi:hypothetical protein
MRGFLKLAAIVICSVAVLLTAATYGASYYYTSQHGAGCASCHEMANYVSAVYSSPHQNVGCMDCHEASIATKLRHIRVHLMGKLPEAIRLRDVDVLEMTANCQKCHQQEYATWHAGPHSATYSEIFANAAHNSKRRLMEDCFRCHGMHFDGALGDVVQPKDLKGPWHIARTGFADQPTIPCQACHWVHHEGPLEIKPAARLSVTGPAVHGSLGFFDRRERMHFAAASLPIPQIYDGARLLKVSPDQRQAICYQCHAPRQSDTGSVAALNHWGPQAGSGDDRTPVGVHEGLSCFSCHNGHNESARASCATCHPEMSHCKLDVEKMDTTYANPASRHNIHWVKCTDCHEHGVPQVKKASLPPVPSAATQVMR